MNCGKLIRLALGSLLIALALLPQPVWACATCFGASDSDMAKGMNMGIFTLLVVIVSVLAGVAAFGIFLARRASMVAGTSVGGELHKQ